MQLNNDTSLDSSACKCAGVDLVLFSAMVAIILSQDLTPNQQNLLGGFIQSVGQNLYTLAAARQQCTKNLEQWTQEKPTC